MMQVTEAQLEAASPDPVATCNQDNCVVDVAGEDFIYACCGLRYYEARFRRSPSAAEKAAVQWEIRDQSTKKPAAEPLEKVIHKDMIRLRHLSTKLAGRKIEVRAWLKNQDKEGKKVVEVRLSEVSEYIGLVKKVEAANPGWNGGQVTDAIRRLGDYDNHFWQEMLGQSGPAPAIVASGSLTQADIDRLYNLTSHKDGGASGKTRGVGKDCFERSIALGHVITGLAAGLHRLPSVNLAPGYTLGMIGDSLDNLYATTIAGDIGQAAVYVLAGKQPAGTTIGANTAATEPELIGDIDGFLLGEKKGPSLKGAKLSDVLESYYCRDDLDPEPLSAAHRFALISAENQGEMLDQSKRFAVDYMYGQGTWAGLTTGTSSEVDVVWKAYTDWLAKETKAEEDRRAEAKKKDDAFQKR